MQNQRLKQIAVSLCVVLSLFASSIAACICHDSSSAAMTAASHCEPSPSHDSKADNHSHEKGHKDVSAHHDSTEKHQHESFAKTNFSIDASFEECCCVQSAPPLYAKSETIKIEKQAANYPPSCAPVEPRCAFVEIVETVYSAKPFCLSDSLYNLKSPRAPPRI